MLSTNVNQYLAFRQPQRTWWVYEWGAQVRKYKISKSPHLKKPLSSNKTYNRPIISNQVPEEYSYFILDYFTILKRPSRLYNQDPPQSTKTLTDCCSHLNAISIDDLEHSPR
jgi:hypothetical protein